MARQAVAARMAMWGREANVRLHLHRCRHTHATHAIRRGVDVFTFQRRSATARREPHLTTFLLSLVGFISPAGLTDLFGKVLPFRNNQNSYCVMTTSQPQVHALFPTPVGSYSGFAQQDALQEKLLGLLTADQARISSQTLNCAIGLIRMEAVFWN